MIKPCIWYDGMLFYSRNSTGKAVWDGESSKVKDGLQLLTNLYKDGCIPKDFPTMDTNAAMEDLNSGKAGMVFGARGLPFWAIQNTIKNNSKAEWYAMNMPTMDGSHATIFGWQPVNTAYCISSTCKNPDAIMKMINIGYEYSTDTKSSLYDSSLIGKDTNTVGSSYVTYFDADSSELKPYTALFNALKANDSSGLDDSWKGTYNKVQDYVKTKNPAEWSVWNADCTEPGHSFYLTFGLNSMSMVKNNAYWSLPTDDMTDKLTLIKKMEEEEFTKIITGQSQVSDWDRMVKEWNSVGGNYITQVVNESLKKK